MLQKQASGPAERRVSHVSNASALLTFDAASTVRAIVFHLIDENLAKDVTSESIGRTLERLGSKSFQATIDRIKWIAMTHSQRLEWLLNESQTLTVVASDELVMLRPRRSR